jgi:signal transduction histidine kinase
MANDKPGSPDITRMVISSAFVVENLHNFFPDSIILDTHFRIVAVSREVLFYLGYRHDQLSGRSISVLSTDDFATILQEKLKAGYFVKEKFTLYNTLSMPVDFVVSGFYLGIISSASNVVVLRLENNTKVEELNTRLEHTVDQIDAFIYRTAHDLRGPLATVLGIINLFKMRRDDLEVDQLISLIEAHCHKLDERLKNIVYLAKSDEEFSSPTYVLQLPTLETSLRKTLERNAFIHIIQLSCFGSPQIIFGYNEELINAALSNMLMYFTSLRQQPDCEIAISLHEKADGLEITLTAEGFAIDPRISQVLSNPDVSHYVDILQSSHFAYLFAAAKISAKLRATLKVELVAEKKQVITLRIARPSNQ